MNPSASADPPDLAHVASASDFAQLRAQGIAWLQAASGTTWTDHNLHDPGITLLEQLCFSMTDVAYRAGFPVADHLTSKDGEIHFEALSLHPPAMAFPCRATTLADYRRVLLDAVPGLDDATVLPLGDGVVRLVLKLSQGADASQAQRIAAARDAFLHQRNLGEDLDLRVDCTEDVACALHAQIEIGGPRDALDVLAEVYDRCDRFVARAPIARGLDERLRAGESLEGIYTGPVQRHGFIDDLPPVHGGVERLFLSDLADVVRHVDGVVQVRLSELRLTDPAAAGAMSGGGGSVFWRDATRALRLALPAEGAPATIAVTRRGNTVGVSTVELCRKLDDLRAARRANRARGQADQARRATAVLPRGQHRALDRYHSVQQLLPAVYGVGRNGVPASAPPQAQASAQQLKAYLLLMEQVIAQGLAQLQHVRELFSVNCGSPQTLWTQMVGPDSVPGVERLLLKPAAQIAQEMAEPFDRYAQRKSRALDHLLALYGETYTQNSMRQFGSYHTPRELETLLLQNKAEYLRQIVGLTRDRASGFHPGQPLADALSESDQRVPLDGDEPVNCSGLQRRAGLLLGLRFRHPRALVQALQRQRLALVAEPGARHAALQVPADVAQAGHPAGHAVEPETLVEVQEDLQRMPVLRGPLPQALFRVGVWRSHYRVLAPAGTQGGAAAQATQRLVLGPDEEGRWWHLGDYADAAGAQRAAASLRWFLLCLHQESEGMHVVEHVLLRPLAGGPTQPHGRPHARLRLPADFHALRITVVLPGWTARTWQPAFRHFAEETLRINCPSHLSLQCRWLDFDAMQKFEACWEPWLAARRKLHAAPGDQLLADEADAAACAVIACLVPPGAPDPEAGEGEEPSLQGLA